MISALSSPPGDPIPVQYALRVDKKGCPEWSFKVGEDMPSGQEAMSPGNFAVCGLPNRCTRPKTHPFAWSC
jgi:hypothetical protein